MLETVIVSRKGMMKTQIGIKSIKVKWIHGLKAGQIFQTGTKSCTKQIRRKNFLLLLFSNVFFFDGRWKFPILVLFYLFLFVDCGRKHKIIIVHDSLYMTSEVCQSDKMSFAYYLCAVCSAHAKEWKWTL